MGVTTPQGKFLQQMADSPMTRSAFTREEWSESENVQSFGLFSIEDYSNTIWKRYSKRLQKYGELRTSFVTNSAADLLPKQTGLPVTALKFNALDVARDSRKNVHKTNMDYINSSPVTNLQRLVDSLYAMYRHNAADCSLRLQRITVLQDNLFTFWFPGFVMLFVELE